MLAYITTFITEHTAFSLMIGLFFVNLALGYRSQIDAWAEAHPLASAPLKVLRGIFPDPWMVLQGASLAMKKKLPEAIRSDLAKLPLPAADAMRKAITERPPPPVDVDVIPPSARAAAVPRPRSNAPLPTTGEGDK